MYIKEDFKMLWKEFEEAVDKYNQGFGDYSRIIPKTFENFIFWIKDITWCWSNQKENK